MPSTPDALADRALQHLLTLQGPRKLVAMAGPPGAGKSTVTEVLARRLAELGRTAAVVPMDGFHLDNRVLSARGLLSRKGAPETFDAAGFLHLVSRIAGGEEVVYPVFDRPRDIAIAGAAVLGPETEFVLFEGNYLLLDADPWARLKEYWNFSVRIDVPEEELRARLMARWRDEGLPDAEASAKVEGNDMPNAALVRDRSLSGDLVLALSG
ncbi:nucleoside triphosphate hydrolase [Halovulum dunhuangense]|uniref:Nucleoside triphosphate hydrolase n=1 Tax=Halovulum dunhuangense TaxID=1505036 RepID=A0A849L5Y3_9RHOB|nr:nucleoside triphosphate hydrolase [Halovulum dunhuangense]NNU81815.1 nucleoside triphosphate hydrolase [Halovulum dunhuangense]